MPRPKPSATVWKPGQSGNPAGRQTGSRNKLNEKFILALHDDFVEHGAKVIERVRNLKPDVYLKVIASILPRELHFKDQSAFEGMSVEQIDQTLSAIKSVIATSAPAGLGEGTAPPISKNKLN
jgi:Family of unknown function (DUF5681)